MVDIDEILKHPAFVNIIERGVPKIPEELDEFEPFLADADKEIINYVLLSLEDNKDEFKITLLEEGKITYIGTIRNYKIISLNKIMLRLQNGFNVYIILDKLESNKTIRQVYKDIKENILFVMDIELEIKEDKKNKNKADLNMEKDTILIVKDYFPIMGEKVAEERLLELKELMPETWLFDLHVLGIGINVYNKEAREKLIRLYLPRILGFYIVPIRKANKYNHILQFTYAGTGKTQFYLSYLNVFNINFESRLPTRAHLVYNASTGEYGPIFLKDYVVIDSFDKAINKKSFEKFFSYTEAGLSNGKWTVETSSMKTKKKYSIDKKRFVGFAFLGNIDKDKLNYTNLGEMLQYKTMRDFLESFLKSKGIPKNDIDGFIDRLSIVDINETNITIDKYILPKIITAPYLITLKEYTQNQIYKVNIDENIASKDLEKRLYNYGIMIAKKLRALGIEPAEDIARELVKGSWDWYKYIDESVIKVN
jgi:hypothetical protein